MRVLCPKADPVDGCNDKATELGNEISTGGFPFPSCTGKWTLMAYPRPPTKIIAFIVNFSIFMLSGALGRTKFETSIMPGFEPGTSRLGSECVTPRPSRRPKNIYLLLLLNE